MNKRTIYIHNTKAHTRASAIRANQTIRAEAARKRTIQKLRREADEQLKADEQKKIKKILDED